MTNQYLWARISGRDLDLRAADADRERIAERLRRSHAEGRLDMAEFQERLERCYEAKTFGDLAGLVADLPRQEEAPRPSIGWMGAWRIAPLLPILLVLLVFSAASGHHHGFWLWIPLVFIFWRMSSWRRRRSAAGSRRGPGEWI